MVVFKIPSKEEYSNLYTLSGFPVNQNLVLTNNGSEVLILQQNSIKPANGADGYLVFAKQTVLITSNGNPVWIRGGLGDVIVQSKQTGISPYFSGEASFDPDMYTSNSVGFRRLRVDTGQTGFFRGREFRTFFEFSIGSNNVQIFKFISPVDFILIEQELAVDSGSIRFQALTGSTETATFNTDLPIIGKNRMISRETPYYSSQILIKTHPSSLVFGDGISGGTVVENIRIVAANSTAQQQSVSSGSQTERGLPAGTYYLRLHNFGTGTTTGVYTLIWEERQ